MCTYCCLKSFHSHWLSSWVVLIYIKKIAWYGGNKLHYNSLAIMFKHKSTHFSSLNSDNIFTWHEKPRGQRTTNMWFHHSQVTEPDSAWTATQMVCTWFRFQVQTSNHIDSNNVNSHVQVCKTIIPIHSPSTKTFKISHMRMTASPLTWGQENIYRYRSFPHISTITNCADIVKLLSR